MFTSVVSADYFVSPKANEVYKKNQIPLIKFKKLKGELGTDYHILLNGRDVSNLAHKKGSYFELKKDGIRAYIKNGKNNLVFVNQIKQFQPVALSGLVDFIESNNDLVDLTNPLINKSISFYYDSAGPKIRIDRVSKSKSLVNISGIASDPAGISSVTVNGKKAKLGVEGYFKVSVEEASQYKIIASDKSKYITEVTYQNSMSASDMPVQLLFNNSDLSIFEYMVADAIENSDLQDRLKSNNPVFDGKTSIGYSQLNIDTVQMNRPEVMLRSDGENLSVTSATKDLYTRMKGYSKTCVLFICVKLKVEGDLFVPELLIDASSKLNFGNGQAQLVFNELNVKIPEYKFDVDNVKDRSFYLKLPIVKQVFENVVHKVMEPLLEGVFSELLSIALQEILSESFSKIASINAELNVLDKHVALSINQLDYMPVENGILLSSAIDLTAKTDNSYPYSLGYRRVQENQQLLPVVSEHELQVFSLINWLNYFLSKTQSSGLMDISFCGKTDELFSGSLFGLSLKHALKDPNIDTFTKGTNYKFSLSFPDPPYLTLNQTLDSEFTVNVPSVVISSEFYGGDLKKANLSLSLKLIVDIQLDANVDIVDGKIDTEVIGAPIVELINPVTYIESKGPQLPVHTTTFEDIEKLNLYTLPVLLPAIDAMIGQIPLPSVAGINLELLDLSPAKDKVVINLSTEIEDGGMDLSLIDQLPLKIDLTVPEGISEILCY